MIRFCGAVPCPRCTPRKTGVQNHFLSAKDKRGNLLPLLSFAECYGSTPSFLRSKNDMGLNYFRGFATIILLLFPELQRESVEKAEVTDGTHTGRIKVFG
jgi:hypothetical protein